MLDKKGNIKYLIGKETKMTNQILVALFSFLSVGLNFERKCKGIRMSLTFITKKYTIGDLSNYFIL